MNQLQPELFTEPRTIPNNAPHNNTPTSILAAQSVNAGTQAHSVLIYIHERGQNGATIDEICLALGLPAQSISARTNALHRAELIAPTGTTRLTRYGRQAVVYEITPIGAVTLESLEMS